MSRLPTVCVLGATGSQGGGVIDALLKEGKYLVRGVTRDLGSKKSQDLLARGVEMLEGDVMNPDSLKTVFRDVWAVFAITNYFEPAQMNKETEIGKSIADACKECNVEYLIWSTLPNVDKISNGKWNVPHFTHKAEVDDYIRQIGLKGIFVAAAFYYQNFHLLFPPKKDEDGTIVFSLPGYPESGILPGVDIKEVGVVVDSVLKNPDEWVGKVIPVWGMNAPVSEYLKQFSEVTGKKTKYVELPQNAAGEELGNMFGFLKEYQLFGNDLDVNVKKKLNPQAKSFADWMRETGWGSDL